MFKTICVTHIYDGDFFHLQIKRLYLLVDDVKIFCFVRKQIKIFIQNMGSKKQTVKHRLIKTYIYFLESLRHITEYPYTFSSRTYTQERNEKKFFEILI